MGDFDFLAKISVILASVCVIFAVVGAFAEDIWLASTQWFLLAIFLVACGIYFKLED